ncbi:hypothetical protein TCON_0210 [Astathelohania contejeani]|uniref:Uncharacterized protein n=1 Tax=Astathelohania contejeani TaxID=164912 RepID=A0ABQ7I296_9MICR|nr:hypothetical protein TCON_0210 [Thelohania contejeani]
MIQNENGFIFKRRTEPIESSHKRHLSKKKIIVDQSNTDIKIPTFHFKFLKRNSIDAKIQIGNKKNEVHNKLEFKFIKRTIKKNVTLTNENKDKKKNNEKKISGKKKKENNANEDGQSLPISTSINTQINSYPKGVPSKFYVHLSPDYPTPGKVIQLVDWITNYAIKRNSGQTTENLIKFKNEIMNKIKIKDTSEIESELENEIEEIERDIVYSKTEIEKWNRILEEENNKNVFNFLKRDYSKELKALSEKQKEENISQIENIKKEFMKKKERIMSYKTHFHKFIINSQSQCEDLFKAIFTAVYEKKCVDPILLMKALSKLQL